MKAVTVFNDVIQPVFEEKLKSYFDDMFDVHTGIMFFNFSSCGCIFIDNINTQGCFINVISFFFHKDDGGVYCVDFVTVPLNQKDLRKSIGNIPQCFKEKNSYIFNLKYYKHLNVDYIKKEFLSAFLYLLNLTSDYFNYEKEQEILRLKKFMGEEVF